MGVDYYACKACGDTFPDCGDYTNCDVCSSMFCDDKCAKAEPLTEAQTEHCDCGERFLAKDEGRAFNLEDCSCKSCCFCRQEVFSEEDLLDYALELLKTDRNALGIKYRESLKK